MLSGSQARSVLDGYVKIFRDVVSKRGANSIIVVPDKEPIDEFDANDPKLVKWSVPLAESFLAARDDLIKSVKGNPITLAKRGAFPELYNFATTKDILNSTLALLVWYEAQPKPSNIARTAAWAAVAGILVGAVVIGRKAS